MAGPDADSPARRLSGNQGVYHHFAIDDHRKPMADIRTRERGQPILCFRCQGEEHNWLSFDAARMRFDYERPLDCAFAFQPERTAIFEFRHEVSARRSDRNVSAFIDYAD